MSDYRIFETDEFQSRLRKLNLGQRRVIENKLERYVYPQLRTAPYFGPNIRKLRGYEPETWRYRIGGFRIFYCVNDKERMVQVLTIDDRKDAYR